MDDDTPGGRHRRRTRQTEEDNDKIYGIGGAIHRGDPRGPQGERHRRGRSMLLYFWVTARQRCSVVAPGRLATFLYAWILSG